MSDTTSAGILSIGAYVPERVVTNDDLAKIVDTNDEWIFQRTGIRQRRFARPDEFTSDMAIAATRQALERAEMKPTDVDYIIVATASPDNTFPNTACWVQQGLQMGDIPALDISTACAGFVYAIELGAALVNTDSYRNVLVIGSEKLSSVTNFTDRGSCILFADGAGAAVVTRTPGRGTVLCSRNGARFDYDALNIAAGGSRMPASHETVEKNLHTIALKGRAVYKFAVQKFMEMADEACKRGGISPDQVALVVPHQANVNIIESAMGRVGIGMDRVLINLDRFGNTSSASIPIALDEALRDGRIKRGDYVLLLAFGGGLSWGYNLIRW
ncbi:MAG: ketoacyl-ACP synthase III [Planctomycetes bacterium]|nr:ketoacyl-ACP synthase III [Planctomycetota bacterium]MCW8134128.1 ketoacyl-ACP synthase III [Planctomycetota bacterium]